jgi:uncharacterized membrane protein YhfC
MNHAHLSSILLLISQSSSVAIVFLLPLLLAVWVHRSLGVMWRFFVYGMLVFFVFQLATRIPLESWANRHLGPAIDKSANLQLGWMFLMAVTAGLVEEVGRFLGYRYLFGDQARTWDRAIMYGLGHSALESAALVGGGAVVMLAMVASAVQHQPGALAGAVWWEPLLIGLERIVAIAIQVSLSMVVLQVFLRAQIKWLVMAFIYHSMVDFTATFSQEAFGPVAGETVAAIWSVFALVLIYRFWGSDAPAVAPISIAGETPAARDSVALP